MIRESVLEYLDIKAKENQELWERRHENEPPKLFVSELGGCIRKAYLRLRGCEVTHPFNAYVLEAMRAGIVWEEETARALRETCDVQEQVRVGNDIWAGRIDFLINNTIIEHKATNPINLRYGKRLPYEHHCLQVLAYQEMLGGNPGALLYYRGWTGWAEFSVLQRRSQISWGGTLNGKWKEGTIPMSIHLEMAKMEYWWDKEDLPPKYVSPTTERFACTREYKGNRTPNCPYYGVCWDGT